MWQVQKRCRQGTHRVMTKDVRVVMIELKLVVICLDVMKREGLIHYTSDKSLVFLLLEQRQLIAFAHGRSCVVKSMDCTVYWLEEVNGGNTLSRS